MPVKIKPSRIIISLLFALSILRGNSLSGVELLDSIATCYRRAVPFELSFSLKNPGDNAEHLEGRFRLGANGKFAMLLKTQEIHYDGRWLWSYDRLNQQVVVEELRPQTTLIMLQNLLQGDFKDFKITKSVKMKNKPALHQLVLANTGENAIFKQLTLIVDASSYLILSATYRDFQNNLYQIELGAPQNIAATDWKPFKVPPAADLIDLRPKGQK